MAKHLTQFHANSPRRFVDAYRKLKSAVDARVARVKRPPPVDTPQNETKRPTLTDIRLRAQQEAEVDDSGSNDVTPVDDIRCLVCNEHIKNQSDFDWHLADEHPQFVKYQCGHCDVVTSSKRTLKDHMVAEHADKSPEYSMVRNLPVDLDPFRVKVNNSGDKSCSLCDFASASFALLNQHMESQHLEQVRRHHSHSAHALLYSHVLVFAGDVPVQVVLWTSQDEGRPSDSLRSSPL